MSKFTKTIAGFAGSIALIASLAGSAGAATFNTNLTVGSKGADVTALQEWLVSQGYLTMPAGVAMGYFGNLTKAAVAAYQTAKGISPAAGYFGPITRASVNNAGGSMAGGTSTVPGCAAGAMYSSTTGAPCATASTVPGCAAGAMYSSTTGQPCAGTATGATGITTPGVEGTLTVTSSSAGLASTVYEGDTMKAILGAKVEAKNSDIAIQRVKLNLGSNTTIYNKLYKKLYVVIDGNVVASSDLNSSTVVKDGSTYYITIAGFNSVVPKGSSKQLVIKADLYGTIDSTDRTTLNTGSASQVSFPVNGIRGMDGAGIDQYGPADAAIGRTVTVSAELAETATLAISTNTATPASSDVVAAGGSSENEADKLPLLVFDAKAEKDDVTLTDLTVDITYSGSGTATTTTLYLYDGSTEIDSAAVSATSATVAGATFSDIDFVIPKGTTKSLTIKADIRSADGTVRTIAADIDTADVTAENSRGDAITESGSATGETMSVRNVGPVFTLISRSITKSATAAQNNTSTSTGEATFTLKIEAVGGAIDFGTTGSSTPAFGTATSSFAVYRDGAVVLSSIGQGLVASSTSYDVPSGALTSGLSNTFRVEENNSVTLPVTFRFEGRLGTGALVTGGSYSVNLMGIRWGTATSPATFATTFMANDTDWRTSTISLP